MKKLILTLGVVAAAFLSNADYLMWRVTEEEAKALLKEGETSYNYVSISYKEQGSSGELSELVTVSKETAAAGTISTDLSTLKGTTYSLFVELLNYTGDNWNQVGVSTTPITYTAGAMDNVACIDTGTNMASPMVSVWHGVPLDVPEPTSGMLVMMGFAFLALKRRRV